MSDFRNPIRNQRMNRAAEEKQTICAIIFHVVASPEGAKQAPRDGRLLPEGLQ